MIGPARRPLGLPWRRSVVELVIPLLALVGLPVALMRWVGNPLPSLVPSFEGIGLAIQQRAIAADRVVAALSFVLWALWVRLGLLFLWNLGVRLLQGFGGSRIKVAERVVRPTSGAISKLLAGLAATWVSMANSGVASADVPAEFNDAADPRLDRDRTVAEESPGLGRPSALGPTVPLTDLVPRPGLGQATGAGSVLLVVGVLEVVKRQRRFRASRRPVGAATVGPQASLRQVEHDLTLRAVHQGGYTLTASVRSLSAELEGFAPGLGPQWIDYDERWVVARFDEPMPQRPREPWRIADGGRAWRLPVAAALDSAAFGDPSVAGAPSTLVAIADGRIANLVALGRLAVVGGASATAAIVRSMVYELRFSALACPVDIIAGAEVCPDDVASHVVLCATASEVAEHLGRGRVGHRPVRAGRPVVVFIAADQAASLLSSCGALAPTDRPFAVISVGDRRPAGWRCTTVTGPRSSPDVQPAVRSAADPVMLDDTVAADLGALMAHSMLPQAPPNRGRGDSPHAGGAGLVGRSLRLQLLGPILMRGSDGELTSQQLSLVSFLACVGSATRADIVEALWDGRPISNSRFLNLLAELRSKVGRDHLPEAQRGRYRLIGVTSDVDLFQAALTAAQATAAPEADRQLLAALETVAGVPLTTPGSRYWSWVGHQSDLATRLEAMVADTGYRLAESFRSSGDLVSAKRACEKGLLACPLDENLVTVLAQLHIEQGRVGSAGRLIDDWEANIRRLGCGEPDDGPRTRVRMAPGSSVTGRH